MPILLEQRNVSPQPLPAAGGEGNRRPPSETAVGLGDSGEFNDGSDFTASSAQNFLKRIKTPLNTAKDRLTSRAVSVKPTEPISIGEMFFSRPVPITFQIPFIVAGYVAVELINHYLR